MPLYVYRCTKCLKQDSHFETVENRDIHKICQYCGEPVVRVFSMPNLNHNKTSANKPKDFWRFENTEEATEEHTKQCFKSLEQQGKLKIPDHTVNGKGVGECEDWKEFSDRK